MVSGLNNELIQPLVCKRTTENSSSAPYNKFETSIHLQNPGMNSKIITIFKGEGDYCENCCTLVVNVLFFFPVPSKNFPQYFQS